MSRLPTSCADGSKRAAKTLSPRLERHGSYELGEEVRYVMVLDGAGRVELSLT